MKTIKAINTISVLLTVIFVICVLAAALTPEAPPEWPNTTAGTCPQVGTRTIYQGKTYELKYWDPGDRGAGATPAECSWWAVLP